MAEWLTACSFFCLPRLSPSRFWQMKLFFLVSKDSVACLPYTWLYVAASLAWLCNTILQSLSFQVRAQVFQYCCNISHPSAVPYCNAGLYHRLLFSTGEMQIGKTASELNILKCWPLCLANMTVAPLLHPAVVQTSPMQSRSSMRQKL